MQLEHISTKTKYLSCFWIIESLMMATSVQTCLPSNCKDQHSMKPKSPSFLRRSSMRQNQNSANRKSAVERLEESKANYVKSERVLDTKQEFKNSSHLRVSTGPKLDILLKAPVKQIQETLKITGASDDLKLSYLRLHQQNSNVNKSPPAVRARAKSHSEFRETQITRKHSFASQCSRHRIEVLIDIESQLKRLITSGSRENVAPPNDTMVFGTANTEAQITPKVCKLNEIPKVRRGFSDPTRKSCWLPSQDDNYDIHKSMPDLSPSPHIPALSLSSDDTEGLILSQHRYATEARYSSPKEKPPLIKYIPKEADVSEDVFDSYQEPRRFSNGTGMLHLTPYYPASKQLQRKPVSRSKSDVSHRYSKNGSEYFRQHNNYTNAEIERFFDTMGLDTTAWHHITSPSLISSPPCYFQSISSIDSNEENSSACSEGSVPEVPREGLRNHDLRGHGPAETSIVEKNARVIKWLYNCRKSVYKS